jgi:hypothetical protein
VLAALKVGVEPVRVRNCAAGEVDTLSRAADPAMARLAESSWILSRNRGLPAVTANDAAPGRSVSRRVGVTPDSARALVATRTLL